MRHGILKRNGSAKNNITAVIDEYFPEMVTVFKDPIKGKASRQTLRKCPFPSLILGMGEIGVLAEIRKVVKKTVGIKKVRQLIATAKDSVGVDYGLESAKLKLRMLIDELELKECKRSNNLLTQ